MPELPDIVTYIKALESRIVGERLIRVRVASTFLVRTAQPPIRQIEGRVVRELRRIGINAGAGWPVKKSQTSLTHSSGFSCRRRCDVPDDGVARAAFVIPRVHAVDFNTIAHAVVSVVGQQFSTDAPSGLP